MFNNRAAIIWTQATIESNLTILQIYEMCQNTGVRDNEQSNWIKQINDLLNYY